MANTVSVLVVDDDSGMFQTLGYVLTEKGFEVETAKDGLEAIERIKERSFDVILLDIKMPGMNGVDVLREINRLSPGATTLMMTAYATNRGVQEAKKAGALAVLRKPLNLDKVLAFIEECSTQKSILILDDDLDFCKSLQNILNEKGYKTVIATEIDEAIDLLLGSKYHVMFLDMKLNCLTGLNALVTIKKVAPTVIVILITGYREEMAGLIEKCLKKTAYTCLYKPLDIDVLLELLKDIEKKQLQQILRGH